MGMFDYVHCEYPLPGLDDPTKFEFQTKSLETFFDNYRITVEGKLEVGSCTRIPKGWNPVDFSGVLNFYGDENSGNLFLISFEGEGKVEMLGEDGKPVPKPEVEWFEYDAIFEHGALVSMTRLSQRG